MMKCTLAVLLVSSVSISFAAEMHVVAGNGSPKNNGDAGKATHIAIRDTFGVEISPDGALYVAEVGHHRIRRVDLTTNQITTVAGTGKRGYSGDGGPATAAKLNEPYEIRFDQRGNLYFVEMQNHVIRRIDSKTKQISTIAGTGQPGYGGDGGPASNATFHRPHSIAFDKNDNLYVADIGNHRIRKIEAKTKTIQTIAGTGAKRLPTDGQLAAGPLLGPRALFVQNDVLWIALREGHSVWRMDLADKHIHHVAGSGVKGFSDGSAMQAQFNGPKGIVVDASNNAYVVDTENHAIRRIDGKDRRVSTITDKNTANPNAMNRPHGICIDPTGNLYVGDTLNHRVLRISR